MLFNSSDQRQFSLADITQSTVYTVDVINNVMLIKYMKMILMATFNEFIKLTFSFENERNVIL